MLELCIPCLFGLEGLVARELRRLGMQAVRAENGRVHFQGTELDIARANISSRFGERVLLTMGSFPAQSFDALFEQVKALPWERFLRRNSAFPVKGHCLDSTLHSVPDCQRIIKKAVAERLGQAYGLGWLPEDEETCQIQFSIQKDTAALYLDTSGAGLHKRGYRPAQGRAPLRETLAAAMVEIARYRGREVFWDVFCGSGTIPIEAALMAKNRAPGLYRDFAACHWESLPRGIWARAREEARGREFHGDYRIYGSDVDAAVLELARDNARRAGVEEVIGFRQADACAFHPAEETGIVVTNPPYGERLLEKKEAEALYRSFGAVARSLPGWQFYILSAHTEFERAFGRPADKKRKLYNGRLRCDLFQYTHK